MTSGPEGNPLARFFSSLRLRLLLILWLAFVPTLGLVIYTAEEERHMAAAQAQEHALQLARAAASSQAQLIDNTRHFLAVLAQLPVMRERDPVACGAFLADLLKQYAHYSTFGVIKSDGTTDCRAVPFQPGVQSGPAATIQRVLDARDFAIGDYSIGRVSRRAVLRMGYPILDEAGQVEAVIFASLYVDSLNELAAQALLPPGSTVTANDRNGTILVRYPDPEKWVGQSVPETPIVKIILSQKREGLAEAIGEDGVSRLYAFTPVRSVPNSELYVSVGIPTGLAFAEANQVLTHNLIALGLVTVLVLAATWVVGDVYVFRKVKALLDVTGRLAEGDLSARTGLRHEAGELGQLGRALDWMAAALSQREVEREQAAEQIRRQAARSESLVEAAGRLNAQLDLESVVEAICEETVHALNVPAASVRLYDEAHDTLYSVTSCGLPPEYRERVQPLPRAAYDQFAQRSGSVVVFSDVRNVPDLPDADLYAALDIRTVVGASMLREGQLVGLLNVFTFGEPREFSYDELTLLKGLAAQAALAIANARLYDALQQEERARAGLLHRVITAQEEERMRIARELHDETSQSLTALIVGLDTARLALADSAHKVEERLHATKSIAEGMLENIHRLIQDLRPTLLDDLGLVPAIYWYGEQRLSPLGIVLHLDGEGLPGRLPSAKETVLFRIIQEAMTNVVRHAQASLVDVRLTQEEGYLTLQVTDNGQGFDPSLESSDPRANGFGLRGIQERVSILRGEFHVQTAPGQGTMITVRVPIRQGEFIHVQNPRALDG